MPNPGFYNDNMNRDYPFIHLQTQDLPDSVIADFSCIMAATSEFDAAMHSVYLSKIRKLGTTIEFEFTSDAPGLLDKVLRFTRNTSDGLYATEYKNAVLASEPSLIDCQIECLSICGSDSSEECHGDSSWSGFLVTGDLSVIENFLICNSYSCEIYAELTELCEKELSIPVEPSLIQNLSGSYVRSIGVANAERTRSAAPTDCREYCWPFPIHEHYVRCSCIVGDIRFKEGYNTCISQSTLTNTITINACVGGGEGEPCAEVNITDDEAPPTGKTTLDGALRCDEAIHSINGITRRFFDILGGPGVLVTSIPEENTIIVDVNLQTLAVCAHSREESSVLFPSSIFSSCHCGPV
jgi:hypothetical protein